MRRRRIAVPTPKKPRIINAQVAGSGAGDTAMVYLRVVPGAALNRAAAESRLTIDTHARCPDGV